LSLQHATPCSKPFSPFHDQHGKVCLQERYHANFGKSLVCFGPIWRALSGITAFNIIFASSAYLNKPLLWREHEKTADATVKWNLSSWAAFGKSMRARGLNPERKYE
jgi:hypothetical protein